MIARNTHAVSWMAAPARRGKEFDMLQRRIRYAFRRWGISDMTQPPNFPSCFVQPMAGFPWFCRSNPSHEDLEMQHPVSRLLFDRLPVG